MRTDVWRKLCYDRGVPAITRPGLRLRALSGHELVTKGTAKVLVHEVMCEFYIVDTLSHDALIGDDVLALLAADISFQKRTVTLGGVLYHSQGHESPEAFMGGVFADIDYWRALYPEVFPRSDDPIGHTTSVDMSIDTGDAWPVNQRPYRIPLIKRRFVEQEIDRMLREGVIEPSSSPWASPITLAPKGDSFRLCVDYRRLNALTKKDAYPLPLIQDIFDSLEGATIFSSLDLRSGYWQVPMREDSIEKTAIATHVGLFQFKRMPFGLANGPAVFQRLMNQILAPLVGKTVMVYIDDIVVFSKTEEEHAQHIHQVLQLLKEHDLVVQSSKCHFAMTELKLLGYIVSKDGIRSDPKKVEAIRDMAPPHDVRGIRSFIGMVGYYRQLVPNFAEMAQPLLAMTKKYARFEWTEECQRSWEKLREMLMSDTILAYPQVNKPYKLFTDASKYCVAAILIQDSPEGVEKPVQYISKQLSEAQQRWPVVEREAYAVIYALRKLRPYLHGAQFTIYTDHKPLKCLFANEIKNSKIQCWAVTLAEYAAPIVYVPGKTHVRPDMLSRIRSAVPTDPPPMDPTQAAIILAPLQAPRSTQKWSMDQTQAAIMLGPVLNAALLKLDKITPQDLADRQSLMPEYQLGLDQEEDYFVEEGLLFSIRPPPAQLEYPRLILPKEDRIRVIARAHLEVGHMGMGKTLSRIQEAYKWANMRRDVMKYIDRCACCAVNRVRRERVVPDPMPIAEFPGQVVAMDITGPFAKTPEQNKYLLTFIDHATGYVEAFPMPDKTALSVYNVLQRKFVPSHTPPDVILCDNGQEFRSHIVTSYLTQLGVEIRHTASHNPRCNGRIERFHRTLKDMLRKTVNAQPSNWEDKLGDALLAHRTTTSDSTGFTPFYLHHGRHPTTTYYNLLDRRLGVNNADMGQRVDEITRSLQVAVRNAYRNRQYNVARLTAAANAKPLNIGDTVVLLSHDGTKLDHTWEHGFIITRIRGNVVTVVGHNGQIKNVSRDQVKQVPGDIEWAHIRKKQTRTQRRAAAVAADNTQQRAQTDIQEGRVHQDDAHTQARPPVHPQMPPPPPPPTHGPAQKRKIGEALGQSRKRPWTRGRAEQEKRFRHLIPQGEQATQAKQQCIAAVKATCGDGTIHATTHSGIAVSSEGLDNC